MLENYQHITGESRFVYDMDIDSSNCLYGKVLLSTIAKGRIKRIDTTMASSLKGVSTILTYKDIPGKNDASGFEGDEPCLVEEKIQFYGDAIALVAAESLEIASKAIKLIEVEYIEEDPILTIDQAIATESYLYPNPLHLKRGEPHENLHTTDHYIEGVVETPAQEHWYLETQCSYISPQPMGAFTIYSSTQNPSEIQEVTARVLGIEANMISVKIKTVGGGFGGKETWACKPAAWGALLANATKRDIYFRLNREEDQTISCKRHPFKIWYKVAFNKEGILQSVVYDFYSNGGYARDLSLSIMQRALLHVENAYYSPNIEFTGRCCKTNLLNFGAYRGFGAPQAMLAIEVIMDRISEITNIDPLQVRKRNLFGCDPSQPNHYAYYSQPTTNNRLFDVEKSLRESSNYEERCRKLKEFNDTNKYVKRGIGINFVKFGISFTNISLNQGGALINIYKDGSVQLNHGGVEMGQGLTEKMRLIASKELGISPNVIRVMPTNTDIIPNTSPTAASTGADINGMAILIAAQKLKKRLAAWAAQRLNCEAKNVEFSNNLVYDKLNNANNISFKEVVKGAYWSRISLSSTGYYKTPIINVNSNHIGTPFLYYVYGAAITEVEYDTLTKEYQIIRTDILHDVGKSLNRKVDLGQIEGAFIQGFGWLTMENIKWNNKGKILNNTPDTYKIPTLEDIPKEFYVSLLEDMGNPLAVHQSKAVGEPPFSYGISAYLALENAKNTK